MYFYHSFFSSPFFYAFQTVRKRRGREKKAVILIKATEIPHDLNRSIAPLKTQFDGKFLGFSNETTVRCYFKKKMKNEKWRLSGKKITKARDPFFCGQST